MLKEHKAKRKVIVTMIGAILLVGICLINNTIFRGMEYSTVPDSAVLHSRLYSCKEVIRTIWLGDEPIVFYKDNNDYIWEALLCKQNIYGKNEWYMNGKALLCDSNGRVTGENDFGSNKNPKVLFAGIVNVQKQIMVDGGIPYKINIVLAGKKDILWYVVKNRNEKKPLITFS